MVSFLSILAVGFFLGMRHATDPDHVIAVTIVSNQRNNSRAVLIGDILECWSHCHNLRGRRWERAGGHIQLLQRIKDSGLLPCAGSFDVVWNCIVKALHGLGIDRVRLYLLSEDKESLFAVDHWGMGEDFLFQRRALRDEPHWALLASDCRLHVFQREPGKLAPFEQGITEEMAVREWFCQLLTWNGKIVGKLSGDCKNSGRKLVADDLRPIELFAPLLGSAIGHARLLTNLGSVLRVSSSAVTCDTPTDIMMEVCRAAREIPGVDHGSVFLLDADDLSLGRIEAEYPPGAPEALRFRSTGWYWQNI